jgi:hypothetical protein
MSLSFDFTALLDTAGQFVNSLLPLFMWPLGVTIGLGLVGWIIRAVREALPK